MAAIANDCRFDPDNHRIEPAAVMIEACEHYVKQSWRNRCRFYAADGAQTLNYPVLHEDFGKPLSQMRIDWKTDWLTRHKRAIVSAYGNSPYFEYYQDELFAILDSRPALMLDFNTEILRFLLRKTGIPAEIRFTAEWTAPDRFPCDAGKGANEAAPPETSDGVVRNPNGFPVLSVEGRAVTDLREAFHPKRPDTVLKALGLDIPYRQVFSPEQGFIPDLSAMDLLFNEGPDSICHLMQ